MKASRTQVEKFFRHGLPWIYNPLVRVYQNFIDRDASRMKSELKAALALIDREMGQSTTFIQVGSNDGQTNDPFHDWVIKSRPWAYLFEPVPSLYQELARTYRSKLSPQEMVKIRLINMAVSDELDLMFFSVSDDAPQKLGRNLPFWWNQLGSFDRNHITKHLDGILEPFIVATEVMTTRLDSFMETEGVQNIDVLHIDAEGHDWKILSTLNLNRVSPRLILVEHKHLSSQEISEMTLVLTQRGYRLSWYRSDLLAQR